MAQQIFLQESLLLFGACSQDEGKPLVLGCAIKKPIYAVKVNAIEVISPHEVEKGLLTITN